MAQCEVKLKMKNWKKYLPIIGIVLFIYILFKINLVNILEEIKNVNLSFLFIALILMIITTFIQTYKWYIIAILQEIRVPFIEAVKINMISNFYGLVTPAKLGSVIRAEYLKKYTKNNNIGKGLFNFTIDKILDLTSVIFMVILFSFVFKDKLDLPITFFTTLFLTFVFLTLFFIKKDRSKWFLRFFYRRFHKKLKNKAKMTFDSFYEHIPKKRYFILFFLLNIISWVFVYLIYYVIGLSFGIELSFLYYLAILPISTLVAIIPISFNGLGTREAALISLFGLFNISSAKVFSMSIIDWLIVGIIPAIIAIFLIWRSKSTTS